MAGRPEAASPDNGRALARQYDDWFADARRLAQAGKFRAAARAYRKVLHLRPGDPRAVLELAEALMRTGGCAEPLALLRKAHEMPARQDDDPKRLSDLYRLALAALDFDGAARVGELLLDKTADWEHVLVLSRSSIFQDFGSIKLPVAYRRKAAREFKRFAAGHKGSAWVHYYQDVLREHIGLSHRAGEGFEELASSPAGRYDWMRYAAGVHLLGRRRFLEAAAQFELAATFSKPIDWRAQCHLAEALLCQGQAPKAWAALDRAQRLAPQEYMGDLLAWKAGLLLWSGDYAGALAASEEALKRRARYATGWKGGALVMLGRLEEGLQFLEDALGLVPRDAESQVWKAEALYRLGRFSEALDATDAVVNRGRPTLYGRAMRGLIHGALGRPARLRAEFRLIPTEVVAHVRRRTRAGDMDSDGALRRTLESLLELSLGVRREGHELAIWMR